MTKPKPKAAPPAPSKGAPPAPFSWEWYATTIVPLQHEHLAATAHPWGIAARVWRVLVAGPARRVTDVLERPGWKMHELAVRAVRAARKRP